MTRSETPAVFSATSESASVTYWPGCVLIVWMTRSSPSPAFTIFRTDSLFIAGAADEVSGPSTACGASVVCGGCATAAGDERERMRANGRGRGFKSLRQLQFLTAGYERWIWLYCSTVLAQQTSGHSFKDGVPARFAI